MASKLKLLIAGSLKRGFESELDQELRSHVDQLTEDNVREGMSEDEARRQALITMGGLEQTKEECRDALGARLLADFIGDVRYAFRQVRRSRGFACVVILTLALGIGANTAVFSVLDAVLLRPLPFPDQDRLLFIYGFALTTSNFEQWKHASHSYDRFAAVSIGRAQWIGADEPEQAATADVSVDFLPLLAVSPVLGRWFGMDDFRPDADTSTIVSEEFWRGRLGGRSDVVGQRVSLDGRSCVVIGVMPARMPLPFPDRDFWLPLRSGGRARGVYALARLKPGTDAGSARSESVALAINLAPPGSIPKGHAPIQVVPILEMLVGDVRAMLFVLAGAVGFVYLIACVNVANLMLARATARSKEVSIRLALGASRGRLFRQLSTEALLLATLGAGIGLAASKWCLTITSLLLPFRVPRIEQAGINLPVLAFTASLAVLAALAFGLVPALHTGRSSLQETLRETSQGITDTRRRRALRGVLVVAEVSIALVLLIGAGLLIMTFLRLRPSEPGFNPRDRIALNVQLPSSRFPDESKKLAFVFSAMDRLRALPGVRGVGAASDLPFSGNAWLADIMIDGQKIAGTSVGTLVFCRVITPGFLHLLEMPLTVGREFAENDDSRSAGVAVVNQTFVRRFLEGNEHTALGRRLAVDMGGGRSKEFSLVGIASDARIFGNSSRARPELYLPLSQAGSAMLSFVVHVDDPMKKAALFKQALRGDDKKLMITRIQLVEDLLNSSVSDQRFNATLLGTLAAVALMLALIGTYGVLSYSAGLRVREMGIRFALGARRGQVVWLVLRQGLVLTSLGMLLGAAGAWGLTRYLESLLTEVKPRDLTTFAAAIAAWMIVAGFACLFPAVRAARVDPLLTLRSE
jgi:putative ABC transport system permease protein